MMSTDFPLSTIGGLAAFAAAPEWPPFATAPREPEALPLTPDHLDILDALASEFIAARQCSPGNSAPAARALRMFNKLPQNERIYVALAASDEDLLHFLRLSIAEAIDKLGWPDASAMVARWSKRRA